MAQADSIRSNQKDEEPLSLDASARHLLEECRMVLPGIQALFGFQLIAVFNQRFAEVLTATDRRLHLTAVLLVVTAAACLMAPAAIHRQAEPRSVSIGFLRIASRLLLWGMVPLSIAIAIDVYLVSIVTIGRGPLSILLALSALAFMGVLWLVLPRSKRLRAWADGRLPGE
jgi:hypothetical protein